jgi:hypothetical protein
MSAAANIPVMRAVVNSARPVEFLTGIEKHEFSIGSSWRDKITGLEVVVIDQTPYAIIVSAVALGISLEFPCGVKFPYYPHQLSRLEER